MCIRDSPDWGVQSGHVSSYKGTGETWDPLEDEIWRIEKNRNTGRYGLDLSPIGDFNNDGYPDMAIISRGHQRGDLSGVSEPSGCTFTASGAVYIYLGGPSGLSPTPAFRVHAPNGYNYLNRVIGGFDFNGDGYGDLILTNYSWSGGNGGFVLVTGRDQPSSGGITGICDSCLLYTSPSPRDQRGSRMPSSA